MVYKMIPFNSLRMLREGREGATESAVVPASAPASAGDTPLRGPHIVWLGVSLDLSRY
jgi:hypothetical protein